jgi:hypothetical protein
MNLVAECVIGRFHGILSKEYSGTFYEIPWGQSDIAIHKTNI